MLEREYYTPKNVRHDLESFAKGAGLADPNQLNIRDLQITRITSSNGHPEILGETYLRHAAVALDFCKNSREALAIRGQLLEILKAIATMELSPESPSVPPSDSDNARSLPRTNENNEFIINGKRYLTIASLAKLETIDASEPRIKKIIIENNIQSIKGKSKTNQIHDFYPFEEVKKYTNNAEDLPRANKNNELIIDGERYLTINILGKLETIDASGEKIKKIIRANNIQSVKGKLKNGQIFNFYSIEEVKKYTNVNKDLPRANNNNELIIDGERYLTINILGKLETIDASGGTIEKIIRENNIQGIKGKGKESKICTFYPVEEVKKHTNNTKDLPYANNELIIDGKNYLTIASLAKLETIDANANRIQKIIKENNIQSVKGKGKGSRICDFYPVEEVKKYANNTKDLPRANENNELIIDGKKYLTVEEVKKTTEF